MSLCDYRCGEENNGEDTGDDDGQYHTLQPDDAQVAELHGNLGTHAAGHEGSQEYDGGDGENCQHEAQAETPFTDGNQQSRHCDLNEGDHSAGAGGGKLSAGKAEDTEEGPEDVAQPLDDGSEGVENNAEGTEERGACGYGAQNIQSLLHNQSNTLAGVILSLDNIQSLGNCGLGNAGTDDLFGVGG